MLELGSLFPQVGAVLNLEGESILVPLGTDGSKLTNDGMRKVPISLLVETKNNIWRVLKSLSCDMPLETFFKGYEGYYGYLNLTNLKCKNALELCRRMPDVCTLKLNEFGQYVISLARSGD